MDGQNVQHLMGKCYIHMMISVEVTLVEIGGWMAEEDVDEFHNSLIPGNKKVETAKGILAKRGASTSLHQPGRTSKPSAGIVEILATLKPSVGRRRMTQLPHPGSKQTMLRWLA